MRKKKKKALSAWDIAREKYGDDIASPPVLTSNSMTREEGDAILRAAGIDPEEFDKFLAQGGGDVEFKDGKAIFIPRKARRWDWGQGPRD